MTKREENLKKLLIVTDCVFDRKDGIVRFLSEVIPRIKNKFDIHILVPTRNNQNEDKLLGVDVKYFPIKKKIEDFDMAMPRFREIKREVSGADIIWIQTLVPLGICASHYAKVYKKPVCYYNHVIEWELIKSSKLFPPSFLLEPIVKRLARYYFNMFDLLIAPSNDVENKIRKIGVKTESKIIRLGVDAVKFRKDKGKNQKTRIKNGITIGYVGRIANEKNIDLLKTVFEELSKEHSGLLLLLVGDGTEEMKRQIYGENIMVTGFVNNVENYLNKIDIFVLPSLTETTSLATLEAMSCELPVVASNVGSMKEYIEDGKNGMLFDSGNVEELKKKIKMLIEDKKLRERIGRNARKTVIKMNSWDNVAKQITEVLEIV